MPPRITPVDWRALVRVFEADGFVQDGIRGSHIRLTKPSILRPVIIPKYDEISADIILSNMRTAGMSRDRYFELLQATN
jgi:predicted RNA binding protein YcfA (HicA-like mRNA interferase family)